eukprot:1290831-Rhodomonas_salina.1
MRFLVFEFGVYTAKSNPRGAHLCVANYPVAQDVLAFACAVSQPTLGAPSAAPRHVRDTCPLIRTCATPVR